MGYLTGQGPKPREGGRLAAAIALLGIAASLVLSSTARAQGGFAAYEGPALKTARQGHHAAVLPNGRVMMFGGHGPGFKSLMTAEVLDPGTGQISVRRMLHPHDNGAFARMKDGRYLLAGGTADEGNPAFANAEVYDPRLDGFVEVGSMVRVRAGGSACALIDGRVLVVGGYWNLNDASAYGELFDPVFASFVATGPLNRPRAFGMVLPTTNKGAVVVGGIDPMHHGGMSPKPSIEATPEVFDPGTKTFAKMGDFLLDGEAGWVVMDPRRDVGELRMRDGRFAILASRMVGSSVELAIFVFDPASVSFSKLAGGPAMVLPSGIGALGLVYSLSSNDAYIMLQDYRDGARRFNVMTVSVGTGKATMPGDWFSFDKSYALDACGLSIMRDGRLFVSGGTTTPLNQFDMVPFTQFVALQGPATVLSLKPALEFTFPTRLGRMYRIQSSVDLVDWATVEDEVPGLGQEVQRFYPSYQGPRRFFRVVEVVR